MAIGVIIGLFFFIVFALFAGGYIYMKSKKQEVGVKSIVCSSRSAFIRCRPAR